MNLPFLIARRYLLKRHGNFSSFIIRLSIIATALSVAVMIMAIAIAEGFKYNIREKLYSFLGHVHIELYDVNHSNSLSPDPIKIDQSLINNVQHAPHVVHVSPFAQRAVIAQAHGEIEGVMLKGVGSNFPFSKGITFSGKKIDYSDTDYARQVILSQTTASKLNVSAGDTIRIYFLESNAALPRVRKVVVAGLFHTGMEEVDKNYGICDLRLLQRINDWQPNEINGYQIDIDNEQYADTVSNYIYDQYIKPPLTTETISDIYPNVFDWLSQLNVEVRIILFIMAVVAIINLATTLMILIIEQVRLIGVLKALGMAARRMQQIFLYYAVLVAGLGILGGNLLALVFCQLQEHTGFLKLDEATYDMDRVPIRVFWWQVALVDIVTLVLCILCMWLPTLYIRRIRPARVLQFK